MFDKVGTCGTCKHAEFWDRTAGGRLRDNYGHCVVPIDEELLLSLLPWSVNKPYLRKQSVWERDGLGCSLYEFEEKK